MRNVAKYICAVILLIGFSTYAWGTVDEISGFGDCPWDFCTDCSDYSSGTFTSGTYTFVGTDVKDDSFYEELLLKKKTGALTLPVYNTAVTQIKLYAGAGSSMNDMTISIYVDGTLQTTTTMNNGNTDYGCGYTSRTLSVNYPAGSTITLKNEDKNEIVHLAKIEITHSGSTSGSGIPINKQYYNEGGSFTCTIGGNEVAKVTTGQTVTLTANPNPGYSLYGYIVTAVSRTCNKSYNPPITDYKEDISVTNNTFVVPDVSYFDYIIVEAMWDDCTPNDITINVASGSGSADVASNACEGETVTFTASPATGYQYAGAVVSGDNTYINLSSSQYSFTMPNEDVDIDVNFSAKTYTINLNGNGGMGHTPSVTATYGSHTLSSAITNPSRTGYTFGGWYSGSGGTGTMIINTSGTLQANTSFTDASGNWTHDGGTTLYAKWTANTISLTLDKNNNDASGSTSGTASVKYDATALESGTVHATRAGYVLEGYYAEQACTHKVLTNTGALVNYTGYVVSGKWARATTPTTLYAKWTQLYTLAVANNANVADMTATPSGASAITEGNSSNVAGGTSVTLAHGTVTSPYTWAGWHVTKTSDGTDVTGTCVAGNTLTMPEYNVTVDAYVFADLIAFCEAEPEVTISGTIKVTSTYTASSGVKAKDVLTVSATAIQTANLTVSSDNSAFKFCLTRNGTYSATVTIPVVNHEVSATSVYVRYSPASSSTSDGIEGAIITVSDGAGTPTTASTAAGDVQGRHLPAKFVIATKVGDNWYGLPNNVTATSFGTWDLSYPLIVDDANDPTTATIYTGTTNYLAWGLDVPGTSANRYKNDGEKLYFASAINSKCLAGDAAGLKSSAAVPSSSYEAYEWIPSTTDLESYTLQNGSATTYYVATNGSDKWTTATTGAIVRFLTYNSQDATVTWYNESLGSNHLVNAAENGVITLPGTNPSSCEPDYFQFCGWKEGTIATYATSAPTYITNGAVVTPPKMYYAVYKPTNANRWYTKCPTYYTITYKANSGTGADHNEYTVLTTATAITVETAGFTKEGCTFVGWTNPDDANGTIIYPNSTISGINSDITLNAVWIGTTSVTGTVRLTASAGEEVATSGTEVTINSTDFTCATALRITYYDVTNNVTYGRSGSPSYTSSEFRLCNGSYGSADGSNIDLSSVTGSYNQTFSITYEPNGGANTLDHYQLIIDVLLKNTVIETKTLDLYGRTLPENFAIAIKVGGSWYALPNNMASEGTYDPVLISVTEDASVLNWSAQGPSTVAYKMKDYTPNYSKLRFAAIAADPANENCLWAATGDAAGIRNWSPTSTDNRYAWTVTETNADFNSYTMANLANTRSALKIYNSKWEMYNSGGLSEIHFIPFTPVTPIDVTIMEWGVDEIAVKTVAKWSPSAITAQISGGSPSAVTKTSIGGDLYKLTGVGDLQGNPGEPLALNVTDGGAKQTIIQIPFIVTDTKTEADLADLLVTAGYAANRTAARDLTKNMDVIVRRNGMLSSSSSTSGTFQNIYIYPGGKADFSKDISIQNIYMRGGFSWLGGAYAHPQLLVASSASISGIGSTNHGIFYDIYLDNAIYYMFALPKTVAVTAITNEENGDDWDAWIKSYSGEGRTKTTKETGWSYVTSGSIERGKGYEIAIKPRLNRPYGILRFPLLKSAAWSSETDCSPSVTGWGVNNLNVSDNNKGWNIIGNPFLTAYNNTALPGTSPSGIIQTKTLVEHKPDGVHWDGTYEWATSNVKYFTIPRMTEYEYDDVRAISAGSPVKLEPFFPFFIQVTGDGSVSFNASNRVLKAPSRYAEDTPREVMVDFALTNSNGVKDVAGLTISDQYSADFDMEDKEKTIQNGNASMKVYTMVGEYRTAFNSLPEAVAAQPIPVGYIAPQAGKYDFSLVDGDYSEVEHVWLTDYSESAVVDLLLGEKYEFETEAGAFNERFALNVILKTKEDPIGTGVDAVGDDYDVPIKFIYQDKMYIRYRGVIYDATGKRVREINK